MFKNLVNTDIKTGKNGDELSKREDREREREMRQREKKESMNATWKCSESGKKKICVETYSAICSEVVHDSCTALLFKNLFYHENSKPTAAGGLENERTSEKNTSRNTREGGKKRRGEREENLRERQTKVKQGKIQRMKKKGKGEGKARCW